MSITKTALDEFLDAAVTAVGDGNYDLAKTKLAQADIVLAGMPDYTIGNRRVQYRMQIDNMMKRLDEMKSNSTTNSKNKRVFVKYTRE